MLVPDAKPEGKETFGLKLSGPAGAKIARSRATGTIRDDDPAPSGPRRRRHRPRRPPKVVINEVMADPVGSETDYQYVELLNAAARPSTWAAGRSIPAVIAPSPARRRRRGLRRLE